ncbi:uncharacterized protein LOC121613380 [Chelmon rostratus]|uniref:uncharacterized protein LOC121613380 n=1 Tax=Chelmon rostratus TaxID=109905 RepID=UPI001BEB7542|nr:uncharacterized protein LOC121613380 [Chelmon rostratus]XP_041802690.1 uncharacterized protein LOC121613380 [Chelmon rostratus]
MCFHRGFLMWTRVGVGVRQVVVMVRVRLQEMNVSLCNIPQSVCVCLCVVIGGGTPSSPSLPVKKEEAAVSSQSLNMNVHHTLMCFVLLSLQDGNVGVVHAQIIVYSGTEGGDVTVRCSLSKSGSRMFFCKENCIGEDILIITTGVKVQRGRYSIEYKRSSGGGGGVSMTITQLRKSDSGLYSCGHGSALSDKQIEIIVVDATLPNGNSFEEKTLYARTGGSIVVECSFSVSASRTFFCKDKCEPKDILVETTGDKRRKGRYSIEYIKASFTSGLLYVSITQLNKLDSGRYRCVARGLSRVDFQEFMVVVTDDPNTSKTSSTESIPSATTTQSLSSDQQHTEMMPTTNVWLWVGLTLAAMVVLLSLAVLIYCRKISAKPEEPPEEAEHASVSQTNQVYEDIREDRRIRSVAEDDSTKLTYSELNFSNRTGGGHNSALCGNDDDVVYSVPRLKATCQR